MIRLMVLGLLKQRPMSGYEIQQLLQLSRVEQWAGILPGSIYHALKKMATEGLVTVDSVEHTGNRSKAIYMLTDQGRTEYTRLILAALAAPSITFPSELYTGLLFHHDLPRQDVVDAIQSHIEALSRKYEEAKQGQDRKREHQPLPREAEMVFENVFELYETHLKFLGQLRAVFDSSTE